MLRHVLTLAAGVLLAIGVAAPVGAAVYKWTDSQGRVVYSDQPPPVKVKSEQLQAAPPPANPNAVKELAQQETAYRKRQADAMEARASADKARAAEADRAQGCAMAKANLSQLADASTPINRYGPNGQREAMTDAERAQERVRITNWMRENKCAG